MKDFSKMSAIEKVVQKIYRPKNTALVQKNCIVCVYLWVSQNLRLQCYMIGV